MNTAEEMGGQEISFRVGDIRATLSNAEHARGLREETVSAMRDFLSFAEEFNLDDATFFHASIPTGANRAAVIRELIRVMRAESRGELSPFVEDFEAS